MFVLPFAASYLLCLPWLFYLYAKLWIEMSGKQVVMQEASIGYCILNIW